MKHETTIINREMLMVFVWKLILKGDKKDIKKENNPTFSPKSTNLNHIKSNIHGDKDCSNYRRWQFHHWLLPIFLFKIIWFSRSILGLPNLLWEKLQLCTVCWIQPGTIQQYDVQQEMQKCCYSPFIKQWR